MFRVQFWGTTAIAAIKDVYAWMAENQHLTDAVIDIVVNRQISRWEAAVYVDAREDRDDQAAQQSAVVAPAACMRAAGPCR